MKLLSLLGLAQTKQLKINLKSSFLTLLKKRLQPSSSSFFLSLELVNLLKVNLFFFAIQLPFEQVEQFCFPEGVATRKIERTKSLSGFNSVVFGSLSRIETSDKSFVFLLNSGEEVYYGVCVHNKEFNTSLPSFITPSSPNVLKSREAQASNRCYCLISRFPFFECHFNVLYAIIAAERHHSVMECMSWTDSFDRSLKISSSDDGPSSSSSSVSPRVPELAIQNLTLVESTESSPRLVLTKKLSASAEINTTLSVGSGNKSSQSRSIIRSYYTLNVPSVGQSVSVTLPGEIPCNLSFPAEKEDGLLNDWTIPILCKSMSLEQLLIFWAAILLEVG